METFLEAVKISVLENNTESLYLILLINNISELAQGAFKKTDKIGLTLTVTADIVERFKLLLFIFCIAAVGYVEAKAEKQCLDGNIYGDVAHAADWFVTAGLSFVVEVVTGLTLRCLLLQKK